jgi:hypothetical protein
MMMFELRVPSWEFKPLFKTEARREVGLTCRKMNSSVKSSNCRASAGSIDELDGWVIGEESCDGADGGSYSSRLNHFRGFNWKV